MLDLLVLKLSCRWFTLLAPPPQLIVHVMAHWTRCWKFSSSSTTRLSRHICGRTLFSDCMYLFSDALILSPTASFPIFSFWSLWITCFADTFGKRDYKICKLQMCEMLSNDVNAFSISNSGTLIRDEHWKVSKNCGPMPHSLPYNLSCKKAKIYKQICWDQAQAEAKNILTVGSIVVKDGEWCSFRYMSIPSLKFHLV